MLIAILSIALIVVSAMLYRERCHSRLAENVALTQEGRYDRLRDDYEDQAERYQKEVQRLRVEKEQALADLAAVRVESETLRGHEETCKRARDEAQRDASVSRLEALTRVKRLKTLAAEAVELLET